MCYVVQNWVKLVHTYAHQWCENCRQFIKRNIIYSSTSVFFIVLGLDIIIKCILKITVCFMNNFVIHLPWKQRQLNSSLTSRFLEIEVFSMYHLVGLLHILWYMFETALIYIWCLMRTFILLCSCEIFHLITKKEGLELCQLSIAFRKCKIKWENALQEILREENINKYLIKLALWLIFKCILLFKSKKNVDKE